MPNWWGDNMFNKSKNQPLHVLVDLGTFPEAGQRADKIFGLGIGKRNFQPAFGGRLLVRIPPSKVNMVFGKYPIRKGNTYFACTHFWDEQSADNTDEQLANSRITKNWHTVVWTEPKPEGITDQMIFERARKVFTQEIINPRRNSPANYTSLIPGQFANLNPELEYLARFMIICEFSPYNYYTYFAPSVPDLFGRMKQMMENERAQTPKIFDLCRDKYAEELEYAGKISMSFCCQGITPDEGLSKTLSQASRP